MKPIPILTGIILLISSTAQAALVSVDNLTLSSLGVAAEILDPAPASATDAAVTNQGQQGFNERRGVMLTAALAVDGGSIAAGKFVDSHMIFFNQPGSVVGSSEHLGVVWEFDGNILGVMSDIGGNLEAASNLLLGAPGTTYEAPLATRGLEAAPDGYTILAGLKTLNVSMVVAQPGDWIRVVTASAIPLPAAVWLFGTALLGFVVISRRRSI